MGSGLAAANSDSVAFPWVDEMQTADVSPTQELKGKSSIPSVPRSISTASTTHADSDDACSRSASPTHADSEESCSSSDGAPESPEAGVHQRSLSVPADAPRCVVEEPAEHASAAGTSSSSDEETSDCEGGLKMDALMPEGNAQFELSRECLTVKNTFFHFELPAELGSSRRALSAPPSRCREPSSKSQKKDSASLSICPLPAAAAPIAPPPASAPIMPRIPTGTEVEIEGLTRAPHFNGRVGVIQSFDVDTDRYDIELEAAVGSINTCRAKVKGTNLQIRAPPAPTLPPSFVPTLSTDDAESIFASAPSMPTTPRWEEEAQQLGDWNYFQCDGSELPSVPAFPRWEDDFQASGNWQYGVGDYVETAAPSLCDLLF